TPGQTVYLNSQYINPGAVAIPSTTINADYTRTTNGTFTDLGNSPFTGALPVGNFVFLKNFQLGGTIAAGVNEYKIVIDSTSAVAESTETDNTYKRAYVIDNTANNNYTLRLDPTGTNIQVLTNGAVSY